MSLKSPQYPDPKRFRDPGGGCRYAFVTFMMRNDSYLPGALVLASGLRRSGTLADLVCLVTGSVSKQARRTLAVLFDHVVEVNETVLPHDRRQERQDRPFLFTRFSALRLGADGDLGFAYEKIVILDADVLPIRHYDHLFTLGTPAGIINERKEHCVQAGRDGRFVVPQGVETTGKWIWHETYGSVCPHGRPIAKDLTDRVRDDPTNMGVNACLWVLRPSMREYRDIMDDAATPETLARIRTWNWPEMQYATLRWSGQWKSVDLRFCSFNGYPLPSVLFGIHFSGLKPWSMKRLEAVRRFARYEDFQYWFAEFRRMTGEYPEVLESGHIRRLLSEVPTASQMPVLAEC